PLCLNPGLSSASCIIDNNYVINQVCGGTTYEPWSANYCDGNLVKRTRVIHNRGCNSDACTASDSNETQTVTACSVCSGGICTALIKPQSTGNVKISGRKLIVNGNEFKVKSVGYAPVPIGSTPDYGYDITVHPELTARDFPLLRAMNVNTIRTWGKVGSASFLNNAWNNGVKPIRIIMGYWMGTEKDYNSLAVRQSILADFNSYVSTYKNYPAVLTWAIGNEENWFYAMQYGNNQKLKIYLSLVNEMAKNAYLIEGTAYHPTTAVTLEMPNQLATIGNYAGGADDANTAYIDVWGINNYPETTYGNWFNDYNSKTTKPLIVTEYGIDALDNTTGLEYESTQAAWDVNLWREIFNSGVSVGASIMEYNDEWWKSGAFSEHNNGGYPTTSHPDGYSNEEWWGIARTTKAVSGLDVITPRQAYYLFQQEFGCGVSLTAASFSQWKSAKFTPAELLNSSISGETADPDGDGINNLAEYAMCLEPKINLRNGLPFAKIENGYLTMTYQRIKNSTDLNFMVSVSHDLSTWNTGPSYLELVSVTDNGNTELVKYRDLVPVANSQQGYLKLKVA
ncbi:MAG: hypothetical protein NTY48_01810, partial [Candidatus Diapherotrites archaeon]|nr:hypothetical protein [Candidatus Diapherotrites archaeon]